MLPYLTEYGVLLLILKQFFNSYAKEVTLAAYAPNYRIIVHLDRGWKTLQLKEKIKSTFWSVV